MGLLCQAGILLMAACISPLPAEADCRAGRVGQMPLSIEHNRLFVPVTVNDTPGSFLVDTGAFQSVIDSGFASRAGVRWDQHQPPVVISGFGGHTLPVRAGRLRMLAFAGVKIPDREMPIYDFAANVTHGTAPMAGLIGADLLDVLDVELDFTNHTLSLWRLFGCQAIEPLHWTGDYASIPMHRQSDKHVQIPIWLDGAAMDAVLDTGAGGLHLSREAAIRAGATQDALAHDPVTPGGGFGGSSTSRRHHFKLLLVGKDVYRDIDAAVSEVPARSSGAFEKNDAILGLRYLLQHRVWISYGTETLFMQRIAGAPE
jgi:predicted aspartyl protease